MISFIDCICITLLQSISPGATKTEAFTKDVLDKFPGLPLLQSEDVSAALMYALGTPPHVQVYNAEGDIECFCH